MHCPICFFRDKSQKEIKGSCFGLLRFEHKLEKYKEKFLIGIDEMKSLSECDCYSSYNHKELLSWTDSFLETLKENRSAAEQAFDQIISSYRDFISKSQKVALDNLWAYLEENKLIAGAVHPLQHTHLLFRGRKRGAFNEAEIKEFFHVPFTMRQKIANQRFSISGQPMLYLGSSILGVQKELGLELDDIALAGFCPKYSVYYHKKMFDLKNYVNDVLENTLPAVCEADIPISYFDKEIVPNRWSIETDLQNSILMHICTFPREYTDVFIPEYVLPQMLTTALMEKGYAGIVFPSTKDFSDLTGHHRYSSYYLNVGFFVSYDEKNNFDESLLNTFITYTLDGTESFDLTLDDLRSEMAAVDKASRSKQDHSLPVILLGPRLEDIESGVLCGINYYQTQTGKIELEFYRKMLRHLC